MRRTMLTSKIHRATVTEADLNHVGSLTLDPVLMEAADLLVGEQVAIVDVNNGSRLETYIIEGERGSGVVRINGAAARLVTPGDIVVIIAYESVEEGEIGKREPRVVFVDEADRIAHVGSDPASWPGNTGRSRAPCPLPGGQGRGVTPPRPREAIRGSGT
ncbi:aspartate 1-decarboxylase [Streptomyces laurentii]|uniref:aspartate 1-decarboxylase n=1 Tax=Streptomyces laurentii TaxID=39478 RepID=UPI0033FA670C